MKPVRSKTERLRQRRAIWARLSRPGPPATYRELMDAAGASSTSVVRLDLEALQEAGYVRLGPWGAGRTARVLVPLVEAA